MDGLTHEKRARKKTTKYKNITRVDREPSTRKDGTRRGASHGYFVRVTWKGETRRKFFSDGVYGDRLGALAAAIEWRDAVEAELGKPRTERLVIGAMRPSNTGIRGVRRLVENHTTYYEATWVAHDGQVRRTRYSARKHGARRARRLAQQKYEQETRNRLAIPRRRGPAPRQRRNV